MSLDSSKQEKSTLTHKPLSNISTRSSIPWNEVCRQINKLTSEGESVTGAARILFKSGKPLGSTGRNFSSANSLAATISNFRSRLLAKNARTKKRRVAKNNAPDLSDLKAQIQNILTIPGLEEKVVLQVIGALVS